MEINSAKRVKYAGALHKGQGGKEYPKYIKKEGRVTGLVTCYLRTAFSNTLLNERWKGQEDEKGDVGWWGINESMY